MTRNSIWSLGYLPTKLHNSIFAYNQTFPCVTGSFQIFASFSWISSQIAAMPCFIWKQLVYLWSPTPQGFGVCIPCMAIHRGWGDYTTVYVWNKVWDSRNVCATFHPNALCQSAFTQLLNNTCMIRGKSLQCIKYIEFFTLDGGGNTAGIEKTWWPTFFRAHSCCFFFLSTLSLPLETLLPLYF